MRWRVQSFQDVQDADGIERQHQTPTVPDSSQVSEGLHLSTLHREVLRLLGPAYGYRNLISRDSARSREDWDATVGEKSRRSSAFRAHEDTLARQWAAAPRRERGAGAARISLRSVVEQTAVVIRQS